MRDDITSRESTRNELDGRVIRQECLGSLKVALVANTGWYLYNFRRQLAQQASDRGADVVFVCPHDRYAKKLKDEGFEWCEWRVDRRGINPLGEFAALRGLRAIYRDLRPGVIHHFTVKCVLYGTIASRGLQNCRVINTVTGLGHLFLSNSTRCRIVRPALKRLYRWALTRGNVVPMFQNQDDAELLLGSRYDVDAPPAMTLGSGIDLIEFQTPEPLMTPVESDRPVRVLFAGRIVEQKGIREYVAAADAIVRRGCDAEFIACGDRDPGNRSVIDAETYRNWEERSAVDFLGHRDDLADIMREADIVVLPSYREGMPRILMEAAAMGKPIVTTDVPGCRDVAIDGENALVVPARDSESLADAIARLIADPALRQRLGNGGRRLASKYNVQHINKQILDLYGLFSDSDDAAVETDPVATESSAPEFACDPGC